ncbi:phosphomannomutase [Pseudoalteromonas sp. A25]|uniref:phosphomannomutase n=1 Tax=Pseudoalteromonas sp. A25 TaxID=116092 RepID=UPI0012608DC2|nr:phosphomannomutase [Pseudoalteromonas sp. A25]BBN82620.1 phosphomannomutase [Pseudoalteromonas sp. A25]
MDELNMRANEIIAQSGIGFGTSGARGLVTQFTPEVCGAFTLAFLSSQPKTKRIAIAIDNRPSSPEIAKACISALNIQGISVDYYGVVPTPALAYAAQLEQIPAIMVTGSHIPFDRNGLKFYRTDGEISKADEQSILSSDIEVEKLSLNELPPVNSFAREQYLKRYLDVFASDLLQGLHIGVYQHSSAGRDLYPELFEALGAKVTTLGYSDSFVPIDTEAVADEDKQQARAWSKEHKLDAIFSTDGDGDRPLLADEHGEYLRGDILCLLAAQHLEIEALAVPVSCNTAIELTQSFKQVVRTKIGSPYVIEAFSGLEQFFEKVAGFEANGGFLLGTSVQVGNEKLAKLPTRDAVLPALCVLAWAKQGIQAAVNALPERYSYSDRVKDYARERSLVIINKGCKEPQALLSQLELDDRKCAEVDMTDGLRMTLENGDIIHLRPSGNAPELRCYAESQSEYQAHRLVLCVLAKVIEL